MPRHLTLGDMIRDAQAAEAAAASSGPFDGPGQVYALRNRVASLGARLAAAEARIAALEARPAPAMPSVLPVISSPAPHPIGTLQPPWVVTCAADAAEPSGVDPQPILWSQGAWVGDGATDPNQPPADPHA